jgi:NAD(P)-dependent dehydrogenase (short-subunit alcohol dehydrogenase family)
MAHWRVRAKGGEEVRASVVHTTSVAGFCGSFGQANYSAAKAAVIGLSKVVALEGAAYGVRSNAVSPSARTRFTMAMPGAEDRLRPPEDGSAFDFYAPENVSPLVGWLAEADCPANDQVFHCAGNRVFVVAVPTIAHFIETEGRWSSETLQEALRDRLVPPVALDVFLNPERHSLTPETPRP